MKKQLKNFNQICSLLSENNNLISKQISIRENLFKSLHMGSYEENGNG